MSPKRASTKVERRRALKKRERERDDVVDAAVGALRYAMPGPGLCLPSCVLLQRLLRHFLPSEEFLLHLGSLHVRSQDSTASAITFDPRTPEGIDGGFHAWLEDKAGKVLDPSIPVTLHDEGYDVNPDTYFLDCGRNFVRHGLLFTYDPPPISWTGRMRQNGPTENVQRPDEEASPIQGGVQGRGGSNLPRVE
ncbi:MAG: hypothetical protein L6Q84_28025, partial [Polyangiaceae bacterium]|nr:hypothetical protein [Polyangiaceae bacterium]